MRARVVVALLGVLSLLAAACGGEPKPPVVDASEETPSETVSPMADPDEVKLVELRATDQFDEFAEHERAAQADGARLAWENFAPIVGGKRVEWTNKAELWDSIAPKIRDEALLLGPEHRQPLWNSATAVPSSVDVHWSDAVTGGLGDYVEFLATYQSTDGAMERIWGFLIRSSDGRGAVAAAMPPIDIAERQFRDLPAARDWLREQAWTWVEGRRAR